MVYDMIVKYCKENDISISAFEKKCGFGNGTVGKWNGDINPSLESKKTYRCIERRTDERITDFCFKRVRRDSDSNY